MAAGNQFIRQIAFAIQTGIGLGDYVFTFFNGGQVVHLARYPAIFNFTVWCFQKSVFIGTGVHGERIDQAYIRTFRRFNRTYPAIVGWMHVAHLEPGTFAGQTTRTQRGDTAFMGDFRKRIILVHKLGQLTGTKKFLDGCSDRLGVNQFLRHQAF